MAFIAPQILSTSLWKHKKIGLFGGTFNPPHEGHIHVCQTALRKKDFDFIWWMVTPQNPLKMHQSIPSFNQRMLWSKQMSKNPRIIVTDIERQLKTYKSIDTIKAIKRHFPLTDFTFIAGLDNALSLHHWENWDGLLNEIPFLFISRPPAINLVRNCPAKMYSHTNIEWIYDTKLNSQTSSQIREKAVLVEKY